METVRTRQARVAGSRTSRVVLGILTMGTRTGRQRPVYMAARLPRRIVSNHPSRSPRGASTQADHGRRWTAMANDPPTTSNGGRRSDDGLGPEHFEWGDVRPAGGPAWADRSRARGLAGAIPASTSGADGWAHLAAVIDCHDREPWATSALAGAGPRRPNGHSRRPARRAPARCA